MGREFSARCKAYEFRLPEYPSFVVHRESGVPCQLFQERLENQPADNPDHLDQLVH